MLLGIPNPETDAAGFLASLTQSKHDVTAFVKAKKGIDKVNDDLKSLLLKWKVGGDKWDEGDQAKEIKNKCGTMASELESIVFVHALVSQMRTGSLGEPQGRAARSKAFEFKEDDSHP